MKCFHLLALILCSFFVSAQTDFVPAGAMWHHDHMDGYYRTTYTHDTVIAGVTAKALTVERHLNPESWASYFPELYVYNTSEDTVFVYNYLLHRFTPLYVFNVTDGDTITLPGFYAAGPQPDTLVRFLVDSVRDVLYDTTLLKTVYTTSILNPYGLPMDVYPYVNYGYYHMASGAYAWRIGTLSGGFYPNCKGCAVTLGPPDCSCMGTIRCYSNAVNTIKLVPDMCEKPVSVPLYGMEAADVRVFPDPVADVLYISGAAAGSICRLLSADGRVQVNTMAGGSTAGISVSHLPAGIYFMHITGISGRRDVHRVVIAH